MKLIFQLGALLLGLNSIAQASFLLENEKEVHQTSELQKRIVGGVEVSPVGKYPFNFLMTMNDRPFCGGSLIDPYWVLTAAHCTIGKLPIQMEFVAKRHDLTVSVEDEGARILEFESIHVHPGFNEYADPKFIYVYNDVSLVRLKNPVLDIEPINLDKTGAYSTAGYPNILSGWGSTGEEDPGSSVLREVGVPIVTDLLCQQAYPGIDQSNICAGYDEGLLDACYGDSGSAMFAEDGGKFYQTGIVSSGRGCARPFSYGTYARVSHLAKYIDDIMTNYVNPCSSNPCNNGGLCFVSENTGNVNQYYCLCPVSFTGSNCNTPVCSGIGCNLASSVVLNEDIERFDIYENKLTISGFPTFNSHKIRFYTSFHDIYGEFQVNITSPSGKVVLLNVFDTYIINARFNCFTHTIWDFDASSEVLTCPAPLLPPLGFVDFTGDDLNGEWTISIYNPYRQKVGLLSWGVEVSEVTACSTNTCNNGGVCSNYFGKNNCACPEGVSGDNCEIAPCSPNPCQNGGKCTVDNGPRCVCEDGFSGRYCNQLSCPQGCVFGSCELGGACQCDLGWKGPSCSETDTGNDQSAFCFSVQVYDGLPVPEGLNDIETAVEVSTTRSCAIETSSNGMSIVDVGYVVADGSSDYCCRGKSKIGKISATSNLFCVAYDCIGTPTRAGPGSATFAENPTVYGTDCYHSCISATPSASACSSNFHFNGALATLTSGPQKRAPGDSLYITNTPSLRKDCLVESGLTLASGYKIQLNDGSQLCCSKGFFSLGDETCRSGCNSGAMKGRPFVAENAEDGDDCYSSCYTVN